MKSIRIDACRVPVVAWAAAAALFLAGCSDHPLAVAPQQAAPDTAAFAGSPPGTAWQAGEIIADNFTPRLDLAIKVVGPLVPLGPVVIQLEATANEAIAGGTVELVLPTMAAMAYVGPDKQPRFPPSSKMPAIGSWTLAQIPKGGTWKQSTAIRLPEKGYYQVVVDIRTTGPDHSGLGPYLLDDGHEQAWMFVIEGGGILTREFKDSIFPDRIVPQPGPFRALPGGRTKGRSAMQSAASSSSGSTWLEVVYYDGRRYVPAEGADVYGRLYGQADTSRTIDWRRIPRNGIVAYPCAQPFEYWDGAASVPGTENARGMVAVYGWDAEPYECGDTIQVTIPRAIYVTWSHLNEVIPPIRRHFGYSRPPVRWRIDLTLEGSHFNPRQDMLVLGSRSDKWVVAHEYGHALHHTSLGGLWRTENCQEHYINVASSYTCAFQEGLADYAASIGAPATARDWGGNYEDFRPDHDSRNRPAEVEGSVAALFRDLIDTTNEPGDSTTYSSTYVVEVFRTCRVRSSKRVRGRYVWLARNDVTDFVWCLENRINSAVHRSNFAISVASGVSENAREPTNWNADHIRSTWLKNVGR